MGFVLQGVIGIPAVKTVIGWKQSLPKKYHVGKPVGTCREHSLGGGLCVPGK